jgi:ABC-type transporter Mla subunit MlaD
MSAVALGMNLMLAGLLAAALMLGYRLNGRLKALRDSHDGFAKAVADLDVAAARAEQGLADLRAATDEATDQLADRIEKARALSTKLERQLQGAPAIAVSASTPSARISQARAENPDGEAERLERLGSLLSAARTPRPRPEPAERFARRDPAPSRPRPRFEDDLFDIPAAAPLTLARGRR